MGFETMKIQARYLIHSRCNKNFIFCIIWSLIFCSTPGNAIGNENEMEKHNYGNSGEGAYWAEKARKKFGDYVTVKDFGAIGNANFYNKADGLRYEDATFTKLAHDDTKAIQAAIDQGGAIYFPPGKYLVTKHLEVRGNQGLTIYGVLSNRPKAYIIAGKNPVSGQAYSNYNIVQGWDDSWYAKGETDRNIPPANFAAYWRLIDRYINIRNIGFHIDANSKHEVSAIDLVALQETSYFDGLLFTGDDNTEKGTSIRIRATSIGKEISFNGFVIKNITNYCKKLQSELYIRGRGFDVDVENWVTAPFEHKSNPFYIRTADVTMRNIHCEAYGVGIPTFSIWGTDFSITDSFILVQNLQGDIFDIENPNSNGYAASGHNIYNLRIYPVAGLWSNVTNVNKINIIKDYSQQSLGVRYTPLVQNTFKITRVYLANMITFHASDGEGHYFNQTLYYKSQSGSPIGTTIPDFIGQDLYVTSLKQWYKSVGPTVNDWVISTQKSYRSITGSPVGVIAPLWIGEELLDTVNNKWYKSINLTNTGWVALN